MKIKNSTKVISFLLALLMLLSMAACSVTEEDIYKAADAVSQGVEVINSLENAASDIKDTASEIISEGKDAVSDFATEHPEVSQKAEEIVGGIVSGVGSSDEAGPEESGASDAIDEDGVYTSKDEVALYIYTYGKLPSNFITKKEAEELGWSGGGLDRYAPGKCIGGDRFGNREKLLPTAKGRSYTECDIDTLGANSRGAKRIVFSNDGLIYYTDDHYESFTLLYGEE
ncbi:MAG: ribonuclease [Oscillospiraceae bacterium]|nr:ribonuclease [Oscillospiraceae bacterium]